MFTAHGKESTTTTEGNMNSLEFIEDVTSKPDDVQQQILSEIQIQNSNVEYLNRHGLSGQTNRETFKHLVPVVSYKDLYNDITRIVNGDKSHIFTNRPVSELFLSSGTSEGKCKLIPIIDDEFKRRSVLHSLVAPVMDKILPGLDQGKCMYFSFIKPGYKTPGGLLAQPVTTSYYNSSYFRERPYDPYNNYTSPKETILCPDSYQSMYSQMLCGLYFNKQVLRIGAPFASGFIRAIHFLEKNWSLLSHDIRSGTLNPIITDPSVRESVTKILKPDKNLADFIEFHCSRKSWEGIITRLWPNAKCIVAIVTGSMCQYIPALNNYSNGLPLVSTIYGSSECSFGVNLNPLCKPNEVAYTLIPTMAYFEFLPIYPHDGVEGSGAAERDKEKQQLVDLADVRLGQEYELVVTTYSGLYRYQVGDVLKVAGFKNKAPQFHFVCKKNVILSIDIDKTDEVELHKAVENAINHLVPFSVTLTEYTSYADTTTFPGHYVIFLEVSEKKLNSVPTSVYEECCLIIEESLNTIYRQGRVFDKSIGALEIKIVENGTFDQLMDYAVSLGTSINQYKTPRCVKKEPVVQMLNSRVVSGMFGNKLFEAFLSFSFWFSKK